ncbi:nucleoside deaminase [Pontibacillus marinus]|uniref:Adenosine deaminase n=1 Tax=Pontibacillus marinus BH030004 = DSM 16465 TaxID=1385511 RepID=A0A0A5GJN5_9BACI|nr:nucleoside deaminase [Pontibacillus marinus]KGX91423.1 adenosine deaminase [Pontibacillus marinus BH030004 = DSM 16465]
MEWNEISTNWQRCFELAWETMKDGSKPIAALVIDENGEIIAEGKNAVYSEYYGATVSYNEIAHAEVNALGKIDNRVHTSRAPYTLYSTLEPCPLCTGALYMSSIKNLAYAAKDKFGGSLDMLGKTHYLSRKQINIDGPVPVLDEISIFLNVYFDLTRQNMRPSIVKLHDELAEDYPNAVSLARKWGEDKRLDPYFSTPFKDSFPIIVEGLTTNKSPV